MTTSHNPPFPLVELRPVSNMNRDWVAIQVRAAHNADLARVFETDLLAAIAPLDCVVFLPNLLEPVPGLPSEKIVLVIDSAQLDGEGAVEAMRAHEAAGRRLMLSASVPDRAGAAVRARALDNRANAAFGQMRVPPVHGPHLAHGVDSIDELERCANAGFSWFSGDFALHPKSSKETPDDGTTRRRLLSLLGLLARDADSREIETQLKQDPALSYHLLKLANSAAFSVGTPIHSFAQAISLLGRRQLQRWLQLLLYAREDARTSHHPLLPLAALRGAQLEHLCARAGGARDEQELAFLVGVFSLLDQLLNMPMDEIVDSLALPPAVSAALRGGHGPLGALLALTERQPGADQLAGQDICAAAFWESQLHAYRWAIQVSRNL